MDNKIGILQKAKKLANASDDQLLNYVKRTGDKVGFLNTVNKTAAVLKKAKEIKKLIDFSKNVKKVINSDEFKNIHTEQTFEQLLEFYLFEVNNDPTTTIEKPTTAAVDNSALNANTVQSFSPQKIIALAQKLKDPQFVASKLYVLKKQFEDTHQTAKANKIDMLLQQLNKNTVWLKLKEQYTKK